MKEKVLFALSIVFLFPLTAFSYDTSTHAALTREAYKRSVLQEPDPQEPAPQKPDLLTRLGVAAYGGSLGNAYLDITPDGVVLARHNNPSSGGVTGDKGFTENKFKDANERLRREGLSTPTMQSPTGWLMVGAIREDDFRYDTGNNENSPQDDLYGSNKNMNRIFHHFYDPYRDIPLNGTLGTKTPEWAIEGTHRGPNIGIFSGHDNRFAIKHAREAMFRAATMRRLENGELKPLPAPDPSGFGTTGLQMGELFRVGESEELHRRAYWATVFKSLGHALHLLHDMGQPQHRYS
jgi:hypothetical protein